MNVTIFLLLSIFVFVSLLFLLQEGIRNHFASIDRAEDHEQDATNNYKAEGSGRLVSFVICLWGWVRDFFSRIRALWQRAMAVGV